MGVPLFDAWARSLNLAVSEPLAALQKARVGVDATYYLQQFLHPPVKEPLNSALGGFPLGLDANIRKELKAIVEAGCELHFVFDGLDYGPRDLPFVAQSAALAINSQAFEIYEQDRAEEAITVFKNTGIPTTRDLEEFLKRVLDDISIPFTVAPFGASAQLANYILRGDDLFDAALGSSELFMFGLESIITAYTLSFETHESIDASGSSIKESRFSPHESTFTWLGRQAIFHHLAPLALLPDTFVDALLLAGSSLLPMFPPLKNTTQFPQPVTFPSATSMLLNSGQKVANLCKVYQEDVLLKGSNWYDKYLRVRMAIRHHIVVTKTGSIESLDNNNVPDDLHLCLGLRLPEELIYYLFRGMVRPRVLNWLTSSTALIVAPNQGGESIEYRNLLQSQLRPLREQALAVIAYSLNYYWQQKEIVTKYWFDELNEAKINIKDLSSPKPLVSKWVASEDLIAKQAQKSHSKPGTLFFALHALADTQFASQTIRPSSTDTTPLQSWESIIANVIWRFLHLRGYVDDKHNLTAWGELLETSLRRLGSGEDEAESVFLSVELLRFGLLTPDHMFSSYLGGPIRGSANDKRNCLLVSRMACTGRVIHNPKGYSGPLSRNLLAYHSMVAAIRASLRDILEMCLVSLFLSGEAERDREDLAQLSFKLPFHHENNCVLAIMTKTYLDELTAAEDATSEESREHFKTKGGQWFVQSHFRGSIEVAMKLWDAVYEGVSKAKHLKSQHELWSEVNDWVSKRR